jgi:hypothetical protein
MLVIKKAVNEIMPVSGYVGTFNKQQSEKEEYREYTTNLRRIPLTKTLEAIGAKEDTKNPMRWRFGTMSVWLSKVGQGKYCFYDFISRKGGGGSIDLIIHFTECSFEKALSVLNKIDKGISVLGMLSPSNLKVKEVA